jgi:hypothetical protein
VDWSAVDDTLVFGFEGANAGHYRRMEPAGATTATLIVAFPFDIAVDDTFILCPITPGAVEYATFTATLDEYDAEFDTALNTTPNWRCVEALYKDIGENGLLTSSVNLICGDHAFAGSALA